MSLNLFEESKEEVRSAHVHRGRGLSRFVDSSPQILVFDGLCRWRIARLFFSVREWLLLCLV